MTDYDKLHALLTEFGIGFAVDDSPTGKEIRCSEGSAKIKGYTGFETVFVFDYKGRFVEMGAWE